MFQVSDAEFDKLVSQAIDALPEKYLRNIKNLAFVVEDEPNEIQREQMHLHNGLTLFGLYEGVPLTKRASSYNLVLPDKITLFKRPLEASVNSLEQLRERIYHTLWHEVAHYYGLDHTDIAKRDN